MSGGLNPIHEHRGGDAFERWEGGRQRIAQIDEFDLHALAEEFRHGGDFPCVEINSLALFN